MSTVLDAARNVAEDYPGGAKALAARIDKNQSTFTHELEGAGFAKLGLHTAVKMTLRTGDLRILNAFASECNCMVLQLPSTAAGHDSDAMAHVAAMASEFADVVRAFASAMSDGKVTANELAELRRQWSELELAGQQMLTHAHQVHEQGKPAHIREAEDSTVAPLRGRTA